MDYTPWTLLVDIGLIGLLLAFGTLLRAIVRPLQTLMIPASVLAGVLGLVLGPNALDLLPFSDQLGTYSSVLIVVVFACLAMTDDFDIRKIGRPIASFAGYGVLMYAIQVAIGMLLVLLVLGPLLGTPEAFGALLFAGWAGGFGSAAAMGQVFGDAGQPEIQSLAFTSATVGLLVGVVGGIIQAKVGAVRGHAKQFAGLKTIPQELRTGVLPQDQARPAIGTHTFSGASIESLGFQTGVIAAISAAAYGLSEVLGMLWPAVAFPVFSIAFVVGLAARGLFKAGRATKFVDPESLKSVSGTATDLLIVCGIASIVPTLVSGYILELVILFLVGLAVCLVLGLIVAPRTMEGAWFEKQLFTWGWATGAVATGIALLRIVDPKMKSRTLEDFAIAYIPVLPVEVAAVTFVPTLILAGAAWATVGIWGGIAVIAAVFLIVLSRSRRGGAGSTAESVTVEAGARR
jgi:ESS family glutamate:Na+ symporter